MPMRTAVLIALLPVVAVASVGIPARVGERPEDGSWDALQPRGFDAQSRSVSPPGRRIAMRSDAVIQGWGRAWGGDKDVSVGNGTAERSRLREGSDGWTGRARDRSGFDSATDSGSYLGGSGHAYGGGRGRGADAYGGGRGR